VASEPLHSLSSDLRLARELADMADAISLDRFRSADLAVETKADSSWVTDADMSVERAIRAGIADSRPHDSVLGEEYGTSGSSSRQWIVDPIDGTSNYARGVPVWGTLIALAVDGVPVVGVVSAPALGRRWWGATGLGAYVDDTLGQATTSQERRIRVSDVDRLEDASMSVAGVQRWRDADRLDELIDLSSRVKRSRDFGDMWAYMLLAEGLLDIAGEHDLKPYDMAALIPVVEEAGGRFTSIDGEAGPWHGSAPCWRSSRAEPGSAAPVATAQAVAARCRRRRRCPRSTSPSASATEISPMVTRKPLRNPSWYTARLASPPPLASA
jgi:histidinol-phosphatase